MRDLINESVLSAYRKGFRLGMKLGIKIGKFYEKHHIKDTIPPEFHDELNSIYDEGMKDK